MTHWKDCFKEDKALGSWWIVVACCLPAIALHILVNWKGYTALAFGNVIAHLGIIVTLLFLEMTLQQVFVFLLISVTANMSIRTIILKIRQKKAEREENAALEGMETGEVNHEL